MISSWGKHLCLPDFGLPQNTPASRGASGDDLENGLDLDGRAGGDGGEAQGAAGMVAEIVLAEKLMQQVRGAIHHQVLIGELKRGIDAAEQLDDAQAVERAVSVVHGLQNFHGTFARRLVTLLDGQARPELALDVADVPRRYQHITRTCAQVEVTFFLFWERDAQFLRSLLCSHGVLLFLEGGTRRYPPEPPAFGPAIQLPSGRGHRQGQSGRPMKKISQDASTRLWRL